MKPFVVVAAVALALLVFGTANAADLSGQVPAATLSAMGLGGMQPISDQQGQEIRGKGFVKVDVKDTIIAVNFAFVSPHTSHIVIVQSISIGGGHK